MSAPRIDELTEPPVVRRYYLVPTVDQEFFGYHRPWPVIGPKHTDREHLGFVDSHYHIDGRFIEPWLSRKLLKVTNYETLERVIAGLPLMAPLGHAYLGQRVIEAGPIVYRRLRCYRAECVYDYPITEGMRGFLDLWHAFGGRTCDSDSQGFICPHRRAPLGSLVPHDGVIRCPLHGLRINFATGVVVA